MSESKSLLETLWSPEVIRYDNFTVIPNLLLQVNNHLPKGKKLAPIDLLLIVELASYRRKEGASIFPTHKQLCNALAVSENTLKASRGRLVSGGWLTTRPKAGGRGHYYDLTPTVDRLREIAMRTPPKLKNRKQKEAN